MPHPHSLDLLPMNCYFYYLYLLLCQATYSTQNSINISYTFILFTFIKLVLYGTVFTPCNFLSGVGGIGLNLKVLRMPGGRFC
jgi:hypothetical protein